MSKGLEALKRIRNSAHRLYFEDTDSLFLGEYLKKDLDIIEKELKRLEELEKAFDALSKDDEKAKKLLSLEIEKNRALEIIKEKKVDVPYIIENPEEKNVIWYNARFMGVLCEGWRMLSQKEWDLLRKVLL